MDLLRCGIDAHPRASDECLPVTAWRAKPGNCAGDDKANPPECPAHFDAGKSWQGIAFAVAWSVAVLVGFAIFWPGHNDGENQLNASVQVDPSSADSCVQLSLSRIAEQAMLTPAMRDAVALFCARAH